MKKIILVALALLMPATAVMAKKKKEEVKKDTVEFTVIKQNPITSVKDQHRSGTCWAYSSLGFLEAELLRMGKGEHDL